MAQASPTPIRAATSLDLTLLVTLAAIWGSAFMAIKIGVTETGPLWLVALRVAIGFCALLPWALMRGWVWPDGLDGWRKVLPVAALSTMVPFFLISWGQQYLPSSTTALLMGAGPLLALVISHLTSDDDKLNLAKFIAVLLGFSGVALVLGAAAFTGLRSALLPQAAILLASCCYVSSGVLVRRIPDVPPVRLSTLVLGCSTAVFLPLALVIDGALPALSSDAWLAIVYLGVFPTGIAYILRYHLVRTIGLSVFAHVGNLIPLFGIAFGVLLLGEPLTLTLIGAAALILGGLLVARAGSRRDQDIG